MTNYFNTISKERLAEIAKEVLGPPRRILDGEEHNHMLLVLQFLEPISSSNNQRTQTDVYEQAGKIYHVHYGIYTDRPLIEEVSEFSDK